MSGGYWDYRDRSLATDIFGYHIDTACGLAGEKHDENMRIVIKDNKLGDPEISAIAFDLFCLLYSYDYAESGDSCREDYLKDAEAFKQRWLKTSRTKQVQRMINICTENLRQELYEAFSVGAPKKDEATE